MAISIEKRIDLTEYLDNPDPEIVEQLSIIHESFDGEIVQYYITPSNKTQGDKNSTAIGVYDRDTKTWSYHDYDELVWGKPKHRICGNRIERLGVKAFPGIGAIAFYKLAHRKITRIVAPVNKRKEENAPPVLSAVVNPDGTVTFTLTPPKKPKYECYRIVMENGIFQEDYITYELELTVPKPRVSGTYKCFAIGYGGEGQLYSKDSEAVSLELEGEMDEYEAPFYSKAELKALLGIS